MKYKVTREPSAAGGYDLPQEDTDHLCTIVGSELDLARTYVRVSFLTMEGPSHGVKWNFNFFLLNFNKNGLGAEFTKLALVCGVIEEGEEYDTDAFQGHEFLVFKEEVVVCLGPHQTHNKKTGEKLDRIRIKIKDILPKGQAPESTLPPATADEALPPKTEDDIPF